MWDLPGPGLEPVFPALAGGFLTTVPAGKSHTCLFSVLNIQVQSLAWATWICVLKNDNQISYLLERRVRLSLSVSSGPWLPPLLVAALAMFSDVLFIIPVFGYVDRVWLLYKGAGLNREWVCGSEIDLSILQMYVNYRKISIWDSVSFAMHAIHNLPVMNQPNILFFSPRDRCSEMHVTPVQPHPPCFPCEWMIGMN